MKGNIDASIIASIVDSLPIELIMIGPDDRIVFWNEPGDIQFTRNAEILGTDIRDCHSEKSMEALERMLADMKCGKLDRSEYPIERDGKRFNISYIALRSADGEYQGCLEVIQEIQE